MNNIWHITEMLNWGEEYFTENHIEQPRLNIELLLAKVLSMKRIELYLNYGQVLTEKELAELKELVLRRVKKEPLQYLIGEVDFLDLKIKVSGQVLIPRPETEHMMAKVIESVSPDINKILDVGTGSGCLAIAAAKNFQQSFVDAVDISESAIQTAAINAKLNDVCEKIYFHCSDICSFISKNSSYDLILANPPYISLSDYNSLDSSVKDYEPREALTDDNDGYTLYCILAEKLDSILSERGKAFFEFGINMHTKIEKIFISRGYKVTLYKDLSDIVRFALISRGS